MLFHLLGLTFKPFRNNIGKRCYLLKDLIQIYIFIQNLVYLNVPSRGQLIAFIFSQAMMLFSRCFCFGHVYLGLLFMLRNVY